MKEDFLHFIWKNQYFDKTSLLTTTGEPVAILNQGKYNFDSGPDFTNCKIKINNLEWFGDVEIHCRSSDWQHHHHEKNIAYDSVILHVVWKDDKPVKRTDSSIIPTIELQTKIQPDLLKKYNQLIQGESEILCKTFFPKIDTIFKSSMLHRGSIERLQVKSDIVLETLKYFKGDWDQTAYALLASNFGFKLNTYSFQILSRILPFKIVQKHLKNEFQLQSLLFGSAGLLDIDFKDEYPRRLKEEYKFLSHKYKLNSLQLSSSQWKFSKIRPANFPTLRIAQFSGFIFKTPSLLSFFLSVKSIGLLNEAAEIGMNAYWHDHCLLDKPCSKGFPQLGKESIYNIAINTIVPFLIAYSRAKDESLYLEQALLLLESIPPEKNKIIAKWQSIGQSFNNALETQGAINLFNNYCLNKSCLNCTIGTSILKRNN